MKAYYGVDLGVLTPDYAAEQKDYYLATSAWSEVHPSQLVGSPGVFKTYDLHKARGQHTLLCDIVLAVLCLLLRALRRFKTYDL